LVGWSSSGFGTRWEGRESDSLLFTVDMDDPNLEKIADLDNLMWILDKLSRKSADVNQSIAIGS
jgi:hypothetical protein